MPMITYECENQECKEMVEHFYRPSSIPVNLGCEKCGGVMHQSTDPAIRYTRRASGFFSPIAVDRRLDPATGQYIYSYPGRADDPSPTGYERIELRTMDEAQRFCRDRDREENDLRLTNLEAEKRHWDERTVERRKEIKRQLYDRLGKTDSRVFDLVQRYVDKVRAQRHQARVSRGVGFHIQALEYDKGNRQDYRDDSNPKISVVVNGFRR